LYGLQQHKKTGKEECHAIGFLDVDGKPYEAANFLRRVLHRALERGGL
jgi:hypothetical protein